SIEVIVTVVRGEATHGFSEDGIHVGSPWDRRRDEAVVREQATGGRRVDAGARQRGRGRDRQDEQTGADPDAGRAEREGAGWPDDGTGERGGESRNGACFHGVSQRTDSRSV